MASRTVKVFVFTKTETATQAISSTARNQAWAPRPTPMAAPPKRVSGITVAIFPRNPDPALTCQRDLPERLARAICQSDLPVADGQGLFGLLSLGPTFICDHIANACGVSDAHLSSSSLLTEVGGVPIFSSAC